MQKDIVKFIMIVIANNFIIFKLRFITKDQWTALNRYLEKKVLEEYLEEW